MTTDQMERVLNDIKLGIMCGLETLDEFVLNRLIHDPYVSDEDLDAWAALYRESAMGDDDPLARVTGIDLANRLLHAFNQRLNKAVKKD